MALCAKGPSGEESWPKSDCRPRMLVAPPTVELVALGLFDTALMLERGGGLELIKIIVGSSASAIDIIIQ